MFCLKCEYDLHGTTTGICPECSTAFDHQDPATYHSLNAGPFPKIKRFTLVCCSVPVLFYLALFSAWCCGRVTLGHWPIAWTDDPKFLGSLGVDICYCAASAVGLLLPFAFLGTAISVIADGSLALTYEQRRKQFWTTLLTAVGVWSGFILLIALDPFELVKWFVD